MKPTRLAVLAVICLLLGARASSQGLYFETTKSSGNTEKAWYSPGKFKSVDSDGKGVIVLIDKETIIQLDPENKSYTEMTFADIKKMSDAGKGMLDAMMKKRLESLSPEKRKMMEERMATMNQGSHSETKYDVTNTGESKTISGFPCTKYIVKRNGEDFETIWATKALGNVDAVHKDMEAFSSKMASALNMKNAPLSWFKEIPGFPIETEREHGDASTVSHVEKRSVSNAEFEVPAGYTKEQPKGLENMGE
jgi:hypothetical protein